MYASSTSDPGATRTFPVKLTDALGWRVGDSLSISEEDG
jgi:hypothetical protein